MEEVLIVNVLHTDHTHFLYELKRVLVSDEHVHHFMVLQVFLRSHLEVTQSAVEVTDSLLAFELASLKYFCTQISDELRITLRVGFPEQSKLVLDVYIMA